MRFPKNVLVVYQGGGYDGCYWEWNAFLFDSDREFTDIHSSGYKGITEAEAAYRMYRDIKAGNERDGGVFRVTAYSPMHTFQAEWNPGFVKGVVNFIWEHYQTSPDLNRVKAHICCDACGCEIDDPDEVTFVNYQSDHVLHRCSGPITAHSKICWECFTLGRCDKCWEVSDEDHSYCPDEVEKYGMCEWHHKREIVTVLREGRGNPADPEGAALIAMFAPILTGERQMQLLAPEIAASQRVGFERNVADIAERVIERWGTLSDAEQSAAILDFAPTPKAPDMPLFAAHGIAC